jgi:CRISPR system Cascade subunit CasE
MIASMLVLDWEAVKFFNIRDAYSIHKLIYSLFPGDTRDFLFTEIEGGSHERRVLILSHCQPLIPEAGEMTSKKVPENLLSYESYGFQVQLNPVVRNNGDSKCIPLIGEESIRTWFLKRQEDWGFVVDPASLEIFDLGIQEFQNGTKNVIHNKATFRGILTVCDRKSFRHSFEYGIGRGKAFGFGLLQVRPVI